MNAVDRRDYTPLCCLSATNNIDLLTDLLSAGADVNVMGVQGDTPLSIACKFRNPDECIEALLAAGANVHPIIVYGKLSSSLIEAVSKTMISKPPRAGTIRKLIAAGADIGVRDFYGNTPLHLIMAHEHNAEYVSLLLAIGADIESRNNIGSTPLITACRVKCLDGANVLISSGANVNAYDSEDHTPL